MGNLILLSSLFLSVVFALQSDIYKSGFKVFDANHNGYLQMQELGKLFLKIIDIKLPENKGASNQNIIKNRLQDLFDKFDHNQDNKISFNEFLETVQKLSSLYDFLESRDKSNISKKNSTQEQEEDYQILYNKSLILLELSSRMIDKAQKLHEKADRLGQEIQKLDKNGSQQVDKELNMLQQRTRLYVQGHNLALQANRVYEEAQKLNEKSKELYKKAHKQQREQSDML